MKKLTREERINLLELRVLGTRQKDIASILGISQPSVSRILTAEGFDSTDERELEKLLKKEKLLQVWNKIKGFFRR